MILKIKAYAAYILAVVAGFFAIVFYRQKAKTATKRAKRAEAQNQRTAEIYQASMEAEEKYNAQVQAAIDRANAKRDAWLSRKR